MALAKLWFLMFSESMEVSSPVNLDPEKALGEASRMADLGVFIKCKGQPLGSLLS